MTDRTSSRDSAASADQRKLTPRKIAAMYGISPDKVLGWIRSGELRAINVATTQGGRPRYVIDPDDLAAFESRRQVVPPAQQPARRRRKPEVVEEFY